MTNHPNRNPLKSLEKRAGDDWIINYELPGADQDSMMVFGAATIEDAIRDARASFPHPEDQAVVIIGAVRDE